MTTEDIGSVKAPSWPVERQREIADYLDAETARIDALVAKKQRMIELLERRLWIAFLTWLREVPSPPVSLRRTMSFLTDGPFGSAFTSSQYSSEGAAVVRLGNIGFAEYRSEDQAFIPLKLYSEFERHRVQEGNLLIAGLGDVRNHAGRACVAPALGPAIVKGKCFCARIRSEVAHAEFLALLLSSPLGAELIGCSARGSTRAMINLEVVKEMVVPLPPVADQMKVVSLTRAERVRVGKAAALLTRQVGLLRERRSALITGAVSGELDVSGNLT